MTLILSRKDGSIIKSAGFPTAEKRRRAQSATPFPPAEAVTKAKDDTPKNEEAVTEAEKVSAAEELAAAIYQFMKAAGSLGSTLTTVAAEQDSEDASSLRRAEALSRETDTDAPAEEAEARRGDSQVQLLRLRVKHREIIIFPDPQYLCCVVQRVGKQPGAEGR